MDTKVQVQKMYIYSFTYVICSRNLDHFQTDEESIGIGENEAQEKDVENIMD